MGNEVDLLINYPRSKRCVEERGASKTDADRKIARAFGQSFFDGDRRHGYGGFDYHARFWQPVIPTFQEYYQLKNTSSILDVGCAKGFMLHDFSELISGIHVKGIDVSEYAIENSIEGMAPNLRVGNARELPYKDRSFDLVISVNTVHNLKLEECEQALMEIERVSRGNSFITVDAYRNDAERERMTAWNLTAKTILHVDEWKSVFRKIGYSGDYYWFTP
jgi:SAM-dependent methyltransferase